MRGLADFNYFINNAFSAYKYDIKLFRHVYYNSGYSIISKVINNKMYIPSFMTNEVIQLIKNEDYIKDTDIVCNIPCNYRNTRASTTSKVFRTLFSYLRNHGFININTGKGYNYIGTNGVILNDNNRPIIICCNVYDIVDRNLQYSGPVCLVSPRVFTNTDFVSKSIVKVLIPNIASVNVYEHYPSVLISNMIDDFVNSPKIPDSDDFNESIYKTLENHIEELIDEQIDESQGILQGLDESNTL